MNNYGILLCIVYVLGIHFYFDSIQSQEYLICKEKEWKEIQCSEYCHVPGTLGLI